MVRWLLDRLRRPETVGDRPSPRNAYCSFCRRSHTDVGPFAEGTDLVFICGECAEACVRLIADEQARRAAAPARPPHPRPADGVPPNPPPQ
jgi:ATP-dependent Clp protease ATP-binding subunit ClpX